MKKRVFALVVMFVLCCASVALAKEVDTKPGYSQSEAAVLSTGATYYCQASNQSLWFRFKASESTQYVVTFTSLSLRYYSNNNGRDLTVPVIVSNRYGVTSSYTDVTIPNNNTFKASYSQDGAAQVIAFDAESGTEYYICVNIGAVSQPNDKVEGFFTLALCTEKSHVLSKDAVVLTEPTCETAGISGQICALCGQTSNQVELPALGHSFGEVTVFSEVTCTSAGTNGRICAACGKAEVTALVDAIGHVAGVPVEVRTPTCAEDGNLESHCTVCNELISRETVAALGHQPDAYFVAVSASCESDGMRAQYCTVCAELLDQEKIPAVGHVPGSMQVLKAANCVENGYAEQRCTICNVVISSEEIIALGHVPGEFVQVRPNDVLQTGLLTSSCQQCGEVLDSMEIPAIGSYQIRLDHPASFYSVKGENLSVVHVSDMAQSENNTDAQMTAYLQGQKIVVEESGNTKMSNLAYVPFTVSVCVPANTCFVTTYTFDLSAQKRASNGSAMLMTKLIDLGYAGIQGREVFDPGALANDALISLTSGDYRAPVSGNAVFKVAFNNTHDEAQVVNHYFALYAGINFASTYDHRLLTELTVTATLEDVTESYTDDNLVELINSMN